MGNFRCYRRNNVIGFHRNRQGSQHPTKHYDLVHMFHHNNKATQYKSRHHTSISHHYNYLYFDQYYFIQNNHFPHKYKIHQCKNLIHHILLMFLDRQSYSRFLVSHLNHQGSLYPILRYGHGDLNHHKNTHVECTSHHHITKIEYHYNPQKVPKHILYYHKYRKNLMYKYRKVHSQNLCYSISLHFHLIRQDNQQAKKQDGHSPYYHHKRNSHLYMYHHHTILNSYFHK